MSWLERLLAWRYHPWLALPARLYLGVVFLGASFHKIAQPGSFALDVATYQFLPTSTVNAFALVVPWVELFTGGLLIVGVLVRPAALLTSALMVAFMIALGWALYLGLDMPCGCFASQTVADEDPISLMTMARDAVWLGLGLYVLAVDHRPIGFMTLLERRKHAA
jgi:uncharacterized membrane protein YphA (DoxX/SURF4 family)